ncbi:Bifunctional dethiobiotin synthetase/7,8-diamino-pelargonic acid aminotransferase, mitochondrial [Grifola frondosa]|uniref:Bifunctional dethiobiotin synthetase/7,8-diamino-pelargonic acid aminotransferase, mitochondrial n=1 Tax=Grifola frondosa TaxID=5627 RepID=A0A1C7M7R8_GRIFR|nr:Bifunctional dethiobiotin synthetase/7,8-diamino-pelargonic acid aminotransferase, mitochondrial [Grifola frondosa]
MSLLFKNLRVHQIFGANTDVGKTILTSALVRASASNGNAVYYLKPVSTGPMEDADDEHVKRFAGEFKDVVHAKCLFRFDEPVSPHLAARLANDRSASKIPVPTDDAFVNAVSTHIRQCAVDTKNLAHMYVETAGGEDLCDQPLFLPTVLIGDSKLGGISSTISSYESLLLRGYIVDSILLCRDEYYPSVNPPPDRDANFQENFQLTNKYYQDIVPSSNDSPIFDVIKHLDDCHTRRLSELDSSPRRALDTIWWPFVQHGRVKEQDVNIIDSAWGDFFTVYNGRRAPSPSPSSPSLLEPQFDGSASWWTQAVGHAHPSLALAAVQAAGRTGPGKGWASRVFFSDDGSTGMEVAIKMALRAFATRERGALGGARRKDLGVLGLKGSYHGDTIGAMDACEEGVYTCEWHEAKGYWFDPPSVSIRKGKVVVSLPPAIAAETDDGASDIVTGSLAWTYNMQERLGTPLANVYRTYIERTLHKLETNGGPKIAALVLEPLVMGAGGMIFVDPLFQRVLIDVVRQSAPSALAQPASPWSGLPVIFDEVFIGLYRLGVQSSTSLLGVYPDILVNAKILTGGLVPMATTLASDSIYQAFLSDDKVDALLHGHSYTAYPVGCAVANETLDIAEKLTTSDSWVNAREQWKVPHPEKADEVALWSFWDPGFVDVVSRTAGVSEVMTLGTVLSIKLQDDTAGYQSHSAQKLLESIKFGVDSETLSTAPGGSPFGIHYRTLGNVAYFMLSLNTPHAVVRAIEERVWDILSNRG